MGSEQDKGKVIDTTGQPAGFWIRVGSQVLDGMIFGVLSLIYIFNVTVLKIFFIDLLIVIPGLLYKPLMEHYYGATLGKMICGLRVVNKEGGRLSLGQAWTRYMFFIPSWAVGVFTAIAMFPLFKNVTNMGEMMQQQMKMQNSPTQFLQQLTGLLILLDCIFVAFTSKKRALHDMVAGTFCIKKKDGPEPSWFRTMAFVLLAVGVITMLYLTSLGMQAGIQSAMQAGPPTP